MNVKPYIKLQIGASLQTHVSIYPTTKTNRHLVCVLFFSVCLVLWIYGGYTIITVIYRDIVEATHECDVKLYIINLVRVWYLSVFGIMVGMPESRSSVVILQKIHMNVM